MTSFLARFAGDGDGKAASSRGVALLTTESGLVSFSSVRFPGIMPTAVEISGELQARPAVLGESDGMEMRLKNES